MSTRLYLENVLRNRIPSIHSVFVRGENHHIHAYVANINGDTPKEMLESAHEVLDHYRSITSLFTVYPYKELDINQYDAPELSQKESSIAMLGNTTEKGIVENLDNLFPEIRNLKFLEKGNGIVEIKVAIESHEPADKVLERIRIVAPELLPCGIQGIVSKIESTDLSSDDMQSFRRGRLKPISTNANILKHDKIQKEKFFRLFSGNLNVSDIIPFKPTGNRLFLSPGTTNHSLLNLLPFYDQIFVQLPPNPNQSDADSYIFSQFGISLSDFFYLAKKQRIFPVFKFSYTHYNDAITVPLLEEGIPHIGPAELDLLSMFSAQKWNRGVNISPERAFELFRWMKKLLDQKQKYDFLVAYDLSKAIDFQISMKDNMKSYFAWNGHLAVPHFTPAIAASKIMEHLSRAKMGETEWANRMGNFQWVSINLYNAMVSIAIGDSLGATICDGLTQSAQVLKVAASLLQGSPSKQFLYAEDLPLLDTFLSGLEISYSNSIPIKDYEDIFDSTEVKRMRDDLFRILSGETDDRKIDNLRRTINSYNKEIDNFAKKDRYHLDKPLVDFLGQISKGNEGGGISILVHFALKALEENMAAFKREFTSGLLSELTNLLRGSFNLVSPRVISLHHLKRRLTANG